MTSKIVYLLQIDNWSERWVGWEKGVGWVESMEGRSGVNVVFYSVQSFLKLFDLHLSISEFNRKARVIIIFSYTCPTLSIQNIQKMKAELDLKRDVFRKSIRREQIKNALCQRRKHFLQQPQPHNNPPPIFPPTPNPNNYSPLTHLLPVISSTYSSPFNLPTHLSILHQLSLLPTLCLSHCEILRYLEKLTSKEELVSEEWLQAMELARTLLGRYLQNEQQSVVENQHFIWAILENLGSAWLWGLVSEVRDAEVRKIGLRMFHKFVEGFDTNRIATEEVGWVYSNFITKQPKANFTNAYSVVETFLKAADILKQDDYYDYMLCLLQLCRQQHQIQLLNSVQILTPILSRLMNPSSSDTSCICIALKFVSLMFRGSDALSEDVYCSNPKVLKVLDHHLESEIEEVSTWAVFALANFCANGIEFIRPIFQIDTLQKLLKVYQRGSEKARLEVLYLVYVICLKSGDKFKLRLYEENILGMVVKEVQGDNVSGISWGLDIIYQLMMAAAKMDSLQMTYTKTIRRELIARYGFKRRLQQLITHPQQKISQISLLLLNTYLQGPLLF